MTEEQLKRTLDLLDKQLAITEKFIPYVEKSIEALKEIRETAEAIYEHRDDPDTVGDRANHILTLIEEVVK